MSVEIRNDSFYKFGSPYFDEVQEEYVWGIVDPPDPLKREDDQFYTLRDGDRLDLISHKFLGSPRFFWIILHYNNIPNALDLENYVGVEIRIPSRATLERIYIGTTSNSSGS